MAFMGRVVRISKVWSGRGEIFGETAWGFCVFLMRPRRLLRLDEGVRIVGGVY